jgi:hypothetical protein
MNRLLDILLPRFITEEVALTDAGDHLEIACSMADVKPGERFAAVATVRTLNLFGMGLFPTMIGEPREWPGDPALGDAYQGAREDLLEWKRRALDAERTLRSMLDWQEPRAASDVLAERHRQIVEKGWTPAHDDEHDPGELARAAAAYLLSAFPRSTSDCGFAARLWPWDNGLNPKSKREDVVRAAALALATIERIDRQQSGSPEGLNQPQQGGDQ